MNRRLRSRAGSAVIARDQNDLRARLGDARRDGADSGFRDELYRDSRVAVRVLEVEDQLCQVLDRVYVVMRRRGDQRNAGSRVSGLRDPRIDLLSGKVSALAGLRALSHLDLDFLRAGEIRARDAETSRSDLLYRRVLLGAEARGVFSALARVRFAAETVHSDRHRSVRFLGDRAVGHRSGLEALDNLARGLDLLERNSAVLVVDEIEQSAQSVRLLLVVDHRGVFLEALIVSGLSCLAERDYRLWIVEMILGDGRASEFMRADRVERRVDTESERVESVIVSPLYALADLF